MTSKKHFSNTIYANHDAKLSHAVDGKAHFAHKISEVAKIFINPAPEMCCSKDSLLSISMPSVLFCFQS